MKSKLNISILGLGYVGLPLSLELSKFFNTIGFDISKKRILELNKNIDSTKEIKFNKIKKKNIKFTDNHKLLKYSNFYIVTVPTPVNKKNIPDLKNIISASNLIGQYLKINDIVVYESTVYPGLTEEICVPILEKKSKLKFNKDFFCGYSPERINPGDSKHKLNNTTKIIAASNNKTLGIMKQVYNKITKKGVYSAPNIKTAEAAKIIENTQRDINIALINEISIVFNKLNINTKEVLKAANTKWNFLDFKPGLVGGHCIGVDPFYLSYKAKQVGLKTNLITSGRKINDQMPNFISKKLFSLMNIKKIEIKKSKILILGVTFKENVQDIRNSKVINIYNFLIKKKINVDIYDPLASKLEMENLYNIKLKSKINKNDKYDAIIIAVKHNIFKEKLNKEYLKSILKKQNIIIDLKSSLAAKDVDFQL